MHIVCLRRLEIAVLKTKVTQTALLARLMRVEAEGEGNLRMLWSETLG